MSVCMFVTPSHRDYGNDLSVRNGDRFNPQSTNRLLLTTFDYLTFHTGKMKARDRP